MREKKFNWLALFPIAVLFLSPWMHWLVYHNLLAAWPDMDHSAAHTFGIFASIVAFMVTCLMTFGP